MATTFGTRTSARPLVEVYRTARWKNLLLLAFSLMFVAIGPLMLRDAKETSDVIAAWFCMGFFGLGAVVFVLLLMRPMTLTLDPAGFVVEGGLRPGKKVVWTDVSEFFLFKLPKGGKMIGYNYAQGRAPQSVLLKASRFVGADAGLPGMWNISKADLVDRLNDYRQRAQPGSRFA